jgi:putative SOS response-associated peptidase YedK
MCGRVSEAPALSWAEYYDVMGFDLWLNLPPRYNAPPTATLACVRPGDGQRSAFVAQWGLIPSWAKDRKIGASCSNARAETVDTKPAFRSAFTKRRCLVIANGFYEWDQRNVIPKQPKQPYYFTMRDGNPITFAGLWETWKETPDATKLTTCSIVTCGPNEMMEPFHDRLPVMLPRDLWDVWLDPDIEPAALKELLVPYASTIRGTKAQT